MAMKKPAAKKPAAKKPAKTAAKKNVKRSDDLWDRPPSPPKPTKPKVDKVESWNMTPRERKIWSETYRDRGSAPAANRAVTEFRESEMKSRLNRAKNYVENTPPRQRKKIDKKIAKVNRALGKAQVRPSGRGAMGMGLTLGGGGALGNYKK